MGATDAERQRRYRARLKAHKAGDHSECDPRRCNPDAVTVTADVTRDAATFGPGGTRLWEELGGNTAEGGRRALILQAARLADRLDKLDDFLRGHEDAWMKFHSINEDGSIVQVVVDKALSEERQQAATLKQIVAELRQSSAKTDQPEREASGSDDLARKRAERRAAAGL